jgi:hypothetical protein
LRLCTVIRSVIFTQHHLHTKRRHDGNQKGILTWG